MYLKEIRFKSVLPSKTSSFSKNVNPLNDTLKQGHPTGAIQVFTDQRFCLPQVEEPWIDFHKPIKNCF